MTTLIDKTNRELKMEFKREHKYELLGHEEQLYKEVVYDARPKEAAALEQEFQSVNTLKKSGSSRVRNIHEFAKEAANAATAPSYMKRPTKISHIPFTSEPQGIDPFDYYRTGTPLFSKMDEDEFVMGEDTFRQAMLLKTDVLTKLMWREQEYYQPVGNLIPSVIDDYVYFRQLNNAADSLSLYRMSKTQVEDIGEVPSDLGKAETVFGVGDLVSLYEKYGKLDERIKEFCEKVTDAVRTGDH